MSRAALGLGLSLLALVTVPTAAAQDTAEVWLVGRSVRPSVVRYLEAQLEELGVEVRTTRRVADARGPVVVRVGRRSAVIATREDDELVEQRTVTLPRGLDTAGRARLAHALRTVLRARQSD